MFIDTKRATNDTAMTPHLPPTLKFSIVIIFPSSSHLQHSNSGDAQVDGIPSFGTYLVTGLPGATRTQAFNGYCRDILPGLFLFLLHAVVGGGGPRRSHR